MGKDSVKELDFLQELDFADILTNPILDIAARFWEEDRYRAFQVCYRSMRRLDDLVDDRKATGEKISANEATQFAMMIDDWLQAVRDGQDGDRFQQEFGVIRHRFDIPLWPWERLCRAMIYDLQHDGYASFLSFLRYAEGAAVAPAAVFMHLCGVKRQGDWYAPPSYDIRTAARPLALFSYLVHIMRDFQKDANSHLNYFTEDLLRQHSLTVADLRRIAEGEVIPPSFRKLIAKYRSMAEFYRRLARAEIDRHAPCFSQRYRLSLEVIYNLYLQIFERIDPDRGCFTRDELNPSSDDVKARLELTVNNFADLKK